MKEGVAMNAPAGTCSPTVDESSSWIPDAHGLRNVPESWFAGGLVVFVLFNFTRDSWYWPYYVTAWWAFLVVLAVLLVFAGRRSHANREIREAVRLMQREELRWAVEQSIVERNIHRLEAVLVRARVLNLRGVVNLEPEGHIKPPAPTAAHDGPTLAEDEIAMSFAVSRAAFLYQELTTASVQAASDHAQSSRKQRDQR
jgi:hypothetical protein